jgi:hypothetical protein
MALQAYIRADISTGIQTGFGGNRSQLPHEIQICNITSNEELSPANFSVYATRYWSKIQWKIQAKLPACKPSKRATRQTNDGGCISAAPAAPVNVCSGVAWGDDCPGVVYKRPWMWQLCTQFGYFKPDDGYNVVARGGNPREWPLIPFSGLIGNAAEYEEFFTTQSRTFCEASFGKNFGNTSEGVARTAATFGGRNMPSLTKVTFSNGDRDGWRTVGILPEAAEFYENCVTPTGVQSNGGASCQIDPKQKLGSDIDIFVTTSGSHGEDMIYWPALDLETPPEIAVAQERIKHNVASYVSLASAGS